jgi:hypothetical protein
MACGFYLDETVCRNRGEDWREFWRQRTDREEARPPSLVEKICREYEESAIRFNL